MDDPFSSDDDEDNNDSGDSLKIDLDGSSELPDEENGGSDDDSPDDDDLNGVVFE